MRCDVFFCSSDAAAIEFISALSSTSELNARNTSSSLKRRRPQPGGAAHDGVGFKKASRAHARARTYARTHTHTHTHTQTHTHLL